MPPKESYEGRLLRRYLQSDFLGFAGKAVFDFTRSEGPLAHWGIITLNQVVDVAGRVPPAVRRFRPARP